MEHTPIHKNLGILVKNLAIEFPKYIVDNNKFITMNKIDFYINGEVSYITADIGKKKYICHVNYQGENLVFKEEHDTENNYDERIQILIYDGLLNIYNLVLQHNKKEKIAEEKLIKSLFDAFIKRRKLQKPDNEILSLTKPNKIYI